MLCVVFWGGIDATSKIHHRTAALTLLGHTKQTHHKMVLFKKYDYRSKDERKPSLHQSPLSSIRFIIWTIQIAVIYMLF